MDVNKAEKEYILMVSLSFAFGMGRSWCWRISKPGFGEAAVVLNRLQLAM
jgi:hypothetical protein